MTRTPLHSRPETINEYRRIACDLLDSLRNDAHAMQESNEREREQDAALFRSEETAELAQRLELESWVEQTTQQLRDVLYLLAIGDNGPSAASECDPNGASKQAHSIRRHSATQRLNEDGLLTGGGS